MPDDILNTIDGALRDWEVSADAMRWQPEPPPAASGDGEVLVADGEGGRRSIGRTGGPVMFDIDTEPFERVLAEAGRQVTAVCEWYASAFSALGRQICAVFAVKPWEIGIGPPPSRLSAMHREYHRRSKARRRRRS